MKETLEKLKYRRVTVALRSGGLMSGTVFDFKDLLLVLVTQGADNGEGVDYEIEFIPEEEIIGFHIESKLSVRKTDSDNPLCIKTELVARDEGTLYPFRHDGWENYEVAIKDKINARLKELGIST